MTASASPTEPAVDFGKFVSRKFIVNGGVTAAIAYLNDVSVTKCWIIALIVCVFTIVQGAIDYAKVIRGTVPADEHAAAVARAELAEATVERKRAEKAKTEAMY
ncbi:MAG: hypothetical protein AAGD32_05245 [Planctomycetota bacterium]